jgi:polyisoprenoid-binding protein YceI
MKKILFFLILSATLMFASECHYEAQKIDVEWEAYKTPLKLGVEGRFDDVQIAANNPTTVESFIKSATVKVDTAKINSKNAGRDEKLVKFFFAKQDVQEIKIRVVALDRKVITTEITMNGVTKTVPLKIDIDDDEVEAEGHIDLADFNMLPSLASINKACFDLHKGKTWQDVEIKFELTLKKYCD